MGLFDCIRCNRPLPDGFTGELQTKDLGQSMLTHEITEGGQLMLANGFISQDGPLVASNFTGTINFYGDTYRLKDGSPYLGVSVLWSRSEPTGSNGEPLDHEKHEYDAEFADGKLVEIRQVKPKGIDR